MDYKQWTMAFSQSLASFMQRLGDNLPGILAAVALILVGWLLGRLLQRWSTSLLRRFDWVVRGQAVQGLANRMGMERPVSDVVGAIVFWVVFLFFLTAATEALGLPVLATWLSGISYYLPRILAALLIVFVALLAAGFCRDAIVTTTNAAGITYGSLIGRVAQVVIILVGVVTAVDQLGIDSRFLTATLSITVGAAIGGAALAFGLGARTAVSNIIAVHYVRQTYQVGHTVRLGEIQGRIIEITNTAVILEHPEGRVVVPANSFSESASLLLTVEG